MKKYLICVTFFILSCSICSADFDFKSEVLDELHFNVGVRFWYEKWSDAGTLNFDRTLLYGPVGSISWRKFSLTALYFTGGSAKSTSEGYDSYGDWVIEDEEGTRHDTDIMLSYNLYKYFSVSAGYKFINVSEKERRYAPEYNAAIVDKSQNSYTGPTLGVGFTYQPFSQWRIFTNGSFSYTFFQFDAKTTETYSWKSDINHYHDNYALQSYYFELNVGYDIKSTWIFLLGYRAQYINGRSDKYFDDTISGPTLTILYSI